MPAARRAWPTRVVPANRSAAVATPALRAISASDGASSRFEPRYLITAATLRGGAASPIGGWPGRSRPDDTYGEASARLISLLISRHLGWPQRRLGGDQTMNHPEAPAPEERGQTMAEYAVVLTVITISIVATLALLTSSITNLLNQLIPLI